MRSCRGNSVLLAVQSQADSLVRSLWARPTVLGARVVATVLGNPAYLAEWYVMIIYLPNKQEQLLEKLRLLGTPGRWDHLTQQGGLYCCTGLNGEPIVLISM
uniref:Uncharacterized protein n=1 Tax=Paramormyrops kingsleyae TaxID=1676925 RepID=A0A3B3RYY7_9TELE